ncbi:MAG: hypothetical protein ACJ8BW_22715 [Ktedonobacteraceae bacterium]|jgi:hypothetical protein
METTEEKQPLPSYGLLAINHAYNEGNITFLEWMELSREWALKIIEQYGEGTNCHSPSCYTIEKVDYSTLTL